MITISTNFGTAMIYIVTNFGIVLFWVVLLYAFFKRVRVMILSVFSVGNNRNI